jgi:hypothetical protein
MSTISPIFYLADFLWPIVDPASRIDSPNRHLLPPRQVPAQRLTNARF